MPAIAAGGLATAGGDPVASMLLSLPIGANRNLGNSGVNLRMVNTDFFVQDSWRINRKLTFNYGLRWDYNSPVVDKLDRLPTYDIYTQTYLVPTHDADLPSGPLPETSTLGPTKHYESSVREFFAAARSGIPVRFENGNPRRIWPLV